MIDVTFNKNKIKIHNKMNSNSKILDLINSKNKKEYKCNITKSRNIAIFGATGIVGRELLEILSKRNFPISKLTLFASDKSIGKKLQYNKQLIEIKELKKTLLNNIEIAFLALNNKLSKKYCKIATKKGIICIDKSDAYRDDPDVPLIVAEVNQSELKFFSKKNIISSPNCITIPLVQTLKPLNDICKIKRVIISTYQAVSGIGNAGIKELETQIRNLLNFKDINPKNFQTKIAFNLIPVIHTKNIKNRYCTSEEQKIINETRKILKIPNLSINVTCVRVPVFNAHSQSIFIEFYNSINLKKMKQALNNSQGIVIIDDIANNIFPTPENASGKDLTLIGRIRKDTTDHGISLWLSSDNLRTGSALNAIKILEILCSKYLL
jgi:aspartate-semialdehyde dehydrogenase